MTENKKIDNQVAAPESPEEPTKKEQRDALAVANKAEMATKPLPPKIELDDDRVVSVTPQFGGETEYERAIRYARRDGPADETDDQVRKRSATHAGKGSD